MTLFQHSTITPFRHNTITPFHYKITIRLKKKFRLSWVFPTIKNLQNKSSYVSSSEFAFLEGGIESLHISMSLANNNNYIYMLSFSTEPFLICIPLIQCKLVSIIDVTLHPDDPGRVFQNINIRTLTVK